MSLLTRLFFQFKYLQKPRWDTGISPPELLEFIQQYPPGRAIDLGCGTGTNAITLAKNGWQVTGVDFIGRALQAAREKARQAGVEVDFRQGNVAHLQGVSGPFDLVFDLGCFHSLSATDRPAYVENLGHLLAVHGIYLMYAFFKQTSSNRAGLVDKDLDLLASRLELVRRQDGEDSRGLPSAWFTYRNRS